ncbi:MAG: hypothetical protein DI529_00760 [Chryseobacterium sp.]|nr:MAG: hypothetical protein DI529_00760 [Chryseobacterium sp.]
MRKLFFLFFIFFFSLVFGKTVDPEKKQLFQKAVYEMTLTPEKAVEVLDYLEKNFKLDSEEKDKVKYLRIKSLFFQNNLMEALKQISDNDEAYSSEIIVLKRSILYYLNISDDSDIEEISNKKDVAFSNEIMNLLEELNQNKSKNTEQQLASILEKAKSSNLMISRENLLYLFDFLANNDKGFSHDFFLKGISNLYSNDFQFRISYAKYLINNDETAIAENIISKLPEESLEQTTNLNLKYDYYDLLAKFSAKKQSGQNFKDAVDKKELLLKTINQSRFSAKNKWFNIVEDNLKSEQNNLIKNRQNILFSIIGVGFLVIVLISLWYFQINSQNKEYQNFITKINLLKEKKAPQPQVISEKTENLLLKKLDDFEKTEDFIKSDISLQNLAKKLETNTKYLSETINTHKQKNFNAYINELRINYIIDKLKEKPIYRSYKIKYLAEESGFSTHSAFAAVFKSVTGMSPANYIQLLKQKEE